MLRNQPAVRLAMPLQKLTLVHCLIVAHKRVSPTPTQDAIHETKPTIHALAVTVVQLTVVVTMTRKILPPARFGHAPIIMQMTTTAAAMALGVVGE